MSIISSLFNVLLELILKSYLYCIQINIIEKNEDYSVVLQKAQKYKDNILLFFLLQLQDSTFNDSMQDSIPIYYFNLFISLAKKNRPVLYDLYNPFSPDFPDLFASHDTFLHALIKIISFIGWDDSLQFQHLLETFYVYVTPNDLLSQLPITISSTKLESTQEWLDVPSESAKSLAAQGIANIVFKILLEKHSNGAIDSNSPSTICKRTFQAVYHYVPREKELPFLKSESGIKLATIQDIIDQAINNSQEEEDSLFNTTDSKLDQSNSILSRKLSPFHVNIERFPTHAGPQSFYSGQISINELRDNAIRNHNWQGLNLNEVVANTLILFSKLLDYDSYKNSANLRRQIVKSVLILSDLFSLTQFEWMLDQFSKIYDADLIDDFLLKQYLILGICKVKTISNYV